MNRRDFLSRAMITGCGVSAMLPLDCLRYNQAEPCYFLGADQSNNQIVLFNGIPDTNQKVGEPPSWKFETDLRPTDAKRCDVDGKASVLVATHGAIYKVPFQESEKIIWAETYPSCHSVEWLPDGNLISASSNDHQLTLHYHAVSEGQRVRLAKSVDFRFETSHGVTYDRDRQCIWALGEVLGKFKYYAGNAPRLELLDTFSLPLCHSDGHDLYPHPNGNLLVTTHEGVLELTIGNFAYPKLVAELKGVKSAAADAQGQIYITDPTDIDGYENWQTDSILHLATGEKLTRPGARFYKVRLWERNKFSY